jgi:hypothetical protein
MLAEGPISAGSVTEALRRELVWRDVRSRADSLGKAERTEDFPEVAKLYRVIDSDTLTVVVDRDLVARLENGERVSWRELVRGSVQMWAKNIRKLSIRSVGFDDDLYCWTGPYDPDFLGYMAGILPLIQGQDTGIYA